MIQLTMDPKKRVFIALPFSPHTNSLNEWFVNKLAHIFCGKKFSCIFHFIFCRNCNRVSSLNQYSQRQPGDLILLYLLTYVLNLIGFNSSLSINRFVYSNEFSSPKIYIQFYHLIHIDGYYLRTQKSSS